MSDDKVTKFTLRQAWTIGPDGKVLLVGPAVLEQDGRQVFPEAEERNPQCWCVLGPRR